MRVLVIDDDVAVRMVLSMALEGVEVVEGWRADGVVSTAALEQVDAALVDRRLPDADGLSVVRALRAEPATADLPIVVITADDHPAQRAAAFEAGADEHASKPLDPDQLLALLEAIRAVPPHQRRLRRTLRRARVRSGLEEGGWDDLLAAPPAPLAEAIGRRRRLFSRN